MKCQSACGCSVVNLLIDDNEAHALALKGIYDGLQMKHGSGKSVELGNDKYVSVSTKLKGLFQFDPLGFASTGFLLLEDFGASSRF